MRNALWPLLCAMAILWTGCVSYHNQHVTLTGSNAAPGWGRIRVYATTVVPFEFEEIGFVQVHYGANDSSLAADDKEMTARFIDKVREMGADAVLNFRSERVGPYHNFSVSGVAVKVRKP